MTVIRPNSISGVTSITALANEINVFRHNGVLAGLQLNGVNHHTSAGVSTFHTLNVLGNLDVAGVLTYQDVTNVDSLGIGTFRTGINVSGGQLDVGSNIKLGNAGVITATSFVGSGANLTNLPSSTSDKIEEGNSKVEVVDTGTGEITFVLDGNQKFEITNLWSNFYNGLYVQGSSQFGGNLAIADSIMHLGNSPTRIQFPSNDTILFKTANGERIRIFSNGSVGVGDYSSTNLTHAFQVLRTSGSTYLSSKNTGGNALFYAEASSGNTAKLELMQAGVGNFTLEVGSTNALMFKDDGTERLRITSGGSVNIGDDYSQTTYKTQIETTNQNVLRLVTDSDDANGVELVLRKDSASPADEDNIGNIYFQGNDDSGASTFYASMEAYSSDVSNNSEDGYIRFRTRNNGSMGERVRIAADGKVGMGAQTNPQGNLDIRTTDEDDAIRLVNTSTGDNGIQWWNEYGGLTKRVSMDYGEGDANFDIKCFRADSQDNRPYGNVRILTGSYSSPTVNFRVTTLGSVHMPNQPSFSAADTSGHVYGGNPPPTMVFNNADFNVGNNYNTSNGIFTAPIAGKYQFSFCGMAAGGSGDFQVRITKNGGGYFNNNGSGRGYSTFEPYGFTVLMDLAINDTVQIKIYSSNTNCYIYAGQTWNRFSGYLIG